MSKRTRIIAAVMATMVMTTAFIGCDKDKDGGSSKKSITVWSHLKTNEVDAVRKVAQKWGKENNVNVKVVEDKAKPQQAITALQSSKGPDLIYGLAHDNLGTFVKANVLAEVPSDYALSDDAYANQMFIDAITVGGKKYAVPLGADIVAVLYNKKNVQAPKTMEEIKASKKFAFNATDFYCTYGFLSAGTNATNGGYVFKNNGGTLDPKDIGLNTEGAVAGFEFIQSLVKDGLFAEDITDDIAKGLFKDGKTDYYVTGAWSVDECKKAGVDLGVVPLPTLNGQVMKPFTTVQTGFVSSKSKNQDLAWDLMKYLQENTSDALITEGNRVPALKSAQDSDAFKNNEFASVFLEASNNGVPMPNIPEVQQMWDPGANNLKALLAQTQNAKETGEKLVSQIKEKIDNAK